LLLRHGVSPEGAVDSSCKPSPIRRFSMCLGPRNMKYARFVQIVVLLWVMGLAGTRVSKG